MTTGHLSTADRALLETLTSQRITVGGKPVSATQLRAWRRRGLIDGPSTSSRGRHGLQSSYGPGIVEQVERVAAWLTVHRDLDEAVLVAFGLGRNPPEASLRAAYRRDIDRRQGTATKIIDDDAQLARATRAVFAASSALGPLSAALTSANPANNRTARRDPADERTSPARRRQQQVGDILGLVAEGAASIADQAENTGVAAYLAQLTGQPLSEIMSGLGDQGHASPQRMRQQVDATDYPGLTRIRDLVLPIARAISASSFGGAMPDDERELGLLVAFMVASSRGAPPDALLRSLNAAELATQLTEALGGSDE